MLDNKTKNDIDLIRQAVDVIATLTIKQSPLDDYLETAKDRYLQSNFGLWNTLISLNGIIVTIFTAFAAALNHSLILKIIIIVVVLFSLSSIILLILCYLAHRKLYKEMFDLSDQNRNRLPQEYAEKAATFQAWAIKQNGLIISYEKVSFYLTAGAAAFILAIIVIA